MFNILEANYSTSNNLQGDFILFSFQGWNRLLVRVKVYNEALSFPFCLDPMVLLSSLYARGISLWEEIVTMTLTF